EHQPGRDGGFFREVGEVGGDAVFPPGFEEAHQPDGVQSPVQQVFVGVDGVGGFAEQPGDVGAHPLFGDHRVTYRVVVGHGCLRCGGLQWLGRGAARFDGVDDLGGAGGDVGQQHRGDPVRVLGAALQVQAAGDGVVGDDPVVAL